MKSWKTTLCGLLAIIATAGLAADFGPLAAKIFGFVGSIATAAGLLFARDANVSSEQQGIKPPTSLLLLLILAPLLCLGGCISDQARSDIADSQAVIDGAAATLPDSPQVQAIRANARATAHAVGHDLQPIVQERKP